MVDGEIIRRDVPEVRVGIPTKGCSVCGIKFNLNEVTINGRTVAVVCDEHLKELCELTNQHVMFRFVNNRGK